MDLGFRVLEVTFKGLGSRALDLRCKVEEFGFRVMSCGTKNMHIVVIPSKKFLRFRAEGSGLWV